MNPARISASPRRKAAATAETMIPTVADVDR
jgi:hypothetical protein